MNFRVPFHWERCCLLAARNFCQDYDNVAQVQLVDVAAAVALALAACDNHNNNGAGRGGGGGGGWSRSRSSHCLSCVARVGFAFDNAGNDDNNNGDDDAASAFGMAIESGATRGKMEAR